MISKLQVDYLVLADAVTVAEGKHYIHGGGWGALFLASIPATHPVLGVGIRLRVPWQEAGKQLTLEVDVLNGQGRNSILNQPLRNAINVERSPNGSPGSDVLLHLALSFTNLVFERPGQHAIVLRIDGQHLAESRFDVIALPESPD